MGKTIRYGGMDVHAATISVAIVEGRGLPRSLGTIENRPEAVRRLLGKLGEPKTLRVCYEAGPTGYALYCGSGCTISCVDFPECQRGAHRCDDDVLLTCELGPDGEPRWHRTQCERCSWLQRTCEEPFYDNLCDHRAAYCDGDYLVTCWGARAGDYQECGLSASVARTCLELDDGSAVCAPPTDAQPDAAIDASSCEHDDDTQCESAIDAAICNALDDAGSDDDAGGDCAAMHTQH